MPLRTMSSILLLSFPTDPSLSSFILSSRSLLV
nr:MAG TPA: hypothetical protein [Bacteriophage sp.]